MCEQKLHFFAEEDDEILRTQSHSNLSEMRGHVFSLLLGLLHVAAAQDKEPEDEERYQR